MTTAYVKAAKRTKMTPQTQPIRGKESSMVRNDAGGYVFDTPTMQRVRRFVILGTTAGTYYASEAKITDQNVDHLVAVFKTDDHGPQAVELIAEISNAGLAPKVSPALFALALAFDGSLATKRAAAKVFSTIVRTHSHLLEITSYLDLVRGWGSIPKRAVAGWYAAQNDDMLAYQLVKYKNRSGWTTMDVLRTCHAYPHTETRDALYAWACGKEGKETHLPLIVRAASATAHVMDGNRADYVRKYSLPREALPTEWLNDAKVWGALLETMPMTAMVRNLNKLTQVGVLKPFAPEVEFVVSKLTDEALLKKSRIHPLQLLVALLTYRKGRGVRGSLSWEPVSQISDALKAAFYKSFVNVEPTGKKLLLAVDVSGSMTSNFGGSIISAAEASAGLAMVIARTEPQHLIMGFDRNFKDLGITASDSLETVMRKTQSRTFGETDASAPWRYAIEKKLDVDATIILTDGQTYAGSEHPVQALARYNKSRKTPAKMIQVAMEASRGSLGEGENCLDVVGFTTDMMAIIREFLD